MRQFAADWWWNIMMPPIRRAENSGSRSQTYDRERPLIIRLPNREVPSPPARRDRESSDIMPARWLLAKVP